MGPVKRYFRTMPARRESPETKDSSANLGFKADFGPGNADTFCRDLRAT